MLCKVVTRHSASSTVENEAKAGSTSESKESEEDCFKQVPVVPPCKEKASVPQEGRVTRSMLLSRRLSLEATYIQKDENKVSGLLQRLDAQLASPRPLEGKGRLEGVFELAVEINRLRLNQGDRMDRLTHSFRKWMMPADLESGDGVDEDSSLGLTKSQLLSAASDVWKARVGAKPKYMWLSLKGHSISVDRLCAACTRYRGPLLNILDARHCPPQLLPLSEYLALLMTTTDVIHAELQEPSSLEEVSAQQAKLATLQNEFSGLICLVYACNARFHGVRESWKAPVEIEGFVQQTMAGLGLEADQIRRLRDLRWQMREQLTASMIGANCSSDLLEENLGMPTDKHTVLQLVEAIESCRLDAAGIYVQCATAMVIDVLTPLQSALLMKACATIMASLPPPPPQLLTATRKRFICSLLLDDRLSSWLDIAGTENDLNFKRQQEWGASF